MTIRNRRLAAISLAAVVAALAASPAVTQQSSTPVARYTIDAGTTSGMMAMSAGGGGLGSAFNMMRGGNQVAHELILRLGSTRSATGAAKADHFLPEGARLGPSVPLETPQRAVAEPRVEGMPQGQMQMPRGRLLLFWGCGEHAGPGQPVVVDFSKMAQGQVPPGLLAQANLANEWSVNAGNSKTYGGWPNSESSRAVPANASLLGAHRISGNYSPEIAFNLADDFMPALQLASSDTASGAVNLSWNALPKATGYYAWAMATGAEGGDGTDMVWWTSASSQQFGGPMSDWLSPATVRTLVEAKTVMPASQTTCTVPAEVRQAGGPMLMTYLYGYGPQADFAYPPRPANTRTPWNPEWIARVRFRSSTMLMHGMPGMGAMAADDGAEEVGQAQQPRKPKCRGLRGIAERAAGLCE